MQKIVTIAVPVYGVEKYIERCARSLFEQTYKDIEYLFIDDCTPDKSIEILKSVLEDYPERKGHVRIIRHDKNRGLAAARNTGVNNASGDFILWVDSDDYIDQNTIEDCVKKQSEKDYDMVLFDVVMHLPYGENRIKTNAEFTSPNELTENLINGSVNHGVCGGLIRLSLYRDNDIRTTEGVNMAEDYMVTPKLAYCSQRVGQLHKCFYHYDLTNPNSYSNTFSRARCEQQIYVFQNLFDYFKSDEVILNLLSKQYVNSLNNHVKHALRDGDTDYYFESLDRLKSFNSKFIGNLNIGDRLLYYLKGIKSRKVYLMFAYALKKLKSQL